MDDGGEPGRLLQEFISLDDQEGLLNLLHTHGARLLTEEAERQLGELIEAAEDETRKQRLSERHQLLQALRQMAAIAALPPEEQLLLAFVSAGNDQEMSQLAMRLNERALDDLERKATAKLAAAEGQEAGAIRKRLDGLRQVRQRLLADYGDRLPLVRRLNGWIQTDTWAESEAYLSEHADELLSDEAERVLQLNVRSN